MLNSMNSSFYKKYWSNVADKNDIEFIFVEDFHKDKKNKFEIYRELFYWR